MKRLAEPRLDFLLQPSPIAGIGVFAARSFKKNEPLPLFADGELIRTYELPRSREGQRLLERFGVRDPDNSRLFHCPADFSRMSVGWYLNHSDRPNAAHRDYVYFAVRAIRKGEEVTVDYRTLNETSATVPGNRIRPRTRLSRR